MPNVQSRVADGNDPGEVIVLCRYDEGAAFTDEVKEGLKRYEIPYDGKSDHYRPSGYPGEYGPDFDLDAGVSVYSVHQAKGRQAEQVIVLNVVSGMYGFPPEHRENDLVAPVQDTQTQTAEEERRLFYVALTRSAGELHVLTRANHWSPFIHEVERFLTVERSLGRVEADDSDDDRITITAKVQQLWDDLHETKQQAGILEDQTGTVRFVAWANESPAKVEEDVWYQFEEIELGGFEGETQLTIRSDTTVTPLYQS